MRLLECEHKGEVSWDGMEQESEASALAYLKLYFSSAYTKAQVIYFLFLYLYDFCITFTKPNNYVAFEIWHE